VIHVAASQLGLDFWRSALALPRVHLNPIRYPSKPGKLLTPLLLNWYFILSQPELFKDCEYVCQLTSNCLFFRSGALDYMRNFDYGWHNQYTHVVTASSPPKFLDNDRFRQALCTALQLEPTTVPCYTGPHEGTFLKLALVRPLVNVLLSWCPIADWDQQQDITEECFLPTAVNLLFRNERRGLPIVYFADRNDPVPASYQDCLEQLTALRTTPSPITFAYKCSKYLRRELDNPVAQAIFSLD
jgi:hypothetical protein